MYISVQHIIFLYLHHNYERYPLLQNIDNVHVHVNGIFIIHHEIPVHPFSAPYTFYKPLLSIVSSHKLFAQGKNSMPGTTMESIECKVNINGLSEMQLSIHFEYKLA